MTEKRYIEINEADTEELIKRHGKEVYVMGKEDWNTFTKRLKELEPAVYKMVKDRMNFQITPMDMEI